MIESNTWVLYNTISSDLFGDIMEEFDTTTPPKPDLERPVTVEEWGLVMETTTKALSELDLKLSRDLEQWIPRIIALEEVVYKHLDGMYGRIRELESMVEDLHATDSARRINLVTEDPEWY